MAPNSARCLDVVRCIVGGVLSKQEYGIPLFHGFHSPDGIIYGLISEVGVLFVFGEGRFTFAYQVSF